MRRLVVLAVVASTLPASAAVRPVPRGFAPLSVSLAGERDLWVLGSVPCVRGRCVAIVVSTEGGRSFTRVSAPPLALTSTTSPEIRFANGRDGFAYIAGASAVAGHSVLLATHDGGATWQRLRLDDLLAFATTRRYAYAVTARCSRERCTRFRLQRSPVRANAWEAAATPFRLGGPIIDLTAHGSSVWVLGTRAENRPRSHDTLARSGDDGRTFVTGAGPCVPDLGGSLAPSSSRAAVWAVCPTGMLGGAWRSTDGGATFASLRGLRLVNSAVLAAASRDTAVVAPNGAGAALLRTTDGGQRWTKPRTPGAVISASWIGFADAKVGAALVQTRSDGAPELWRTTDGGATWSAVRLS